MSFNLERRTPRGGGLSRRRQERELDRIDEQAELNAAYIRAAAKETIEVVQAHHAAAAATAEIDMLLSARISRLQVYNVSDADFRAQLQQAARIKSINAVLGFEP